MQTLSKRSFVVLREIARTLFDAGLGVPEDRLDWAMAELHDLLGHVGRLTRFALSLAVAFLQFAPIAVFRRPARFTRLSPEQKARFLARIEGGPFSMLFVVVKLYLCIVYYEHPDASIQTGYDTRALAAQTEASP